MTATHHSRMWGAAGLALLGAAAAAALWVSRGHGPRLLSVGPRLLSNQTSWPLSIVGEGLASGASLRVAGWPAPLPLTAVDDRHAYARLPSGFSIPKGEGQVQAAASVDGAQGQVALTVVNDAAFPDLTSIAVAGDGRVFAASTTTDELFELSPDTGQVVRHASFDGPTALAWWGATLVVAHRFDARLLLLRPSGEVAEVPAAANAEALVVDGVGVAFVAEHARDTVVAVDLATGQKLWRAEVRPNPKALALVAGQLAVGSLQTGDVELVAKDTGIVGSPIAPGPGTPIRGGGTEKFSEYVMGGTGVRALVANGARLYSADIGPNIGPNPQRMEVSMNGGVSEIDAAQGSVLQHRGFGAGVTSALALDAPNGLLYAADPGVGLVRVLDASTLELKQAIPIPPPDGFPVARPASDFGVHHRAGVELHSGPSALALDAERHRLWVLNRFTATAAEIDVALAKEGKASLRRQWPLTDPLTQPKRRLGQILYYADVGQTAMSCDACHVEGHTGGILFEKTFPMRIYRSTTVRASRETPPYFTPASTRSLAETAKEVGGRNRFHNPDPTPNEIEALALFTSQITALPNPFVGADGAPVDELELFDHLRGSPRRGIALFERQCQACHPPPHFTTDQDPGTRGRYLDVGTPEALPLRLPMQNLVGKGMATPSLIGAWDIFPMLGSGSAGLKVAGDRVEVGARFALREVVETYGGPRHGSSAGLTVQERNDLLAYLLSL